MKAKGMTDYSNKTPEELRPALLAAMLTHVAFDGWSAVSLKAAAADIGISSEMAELAYPRGAVEVLEAHLQAADTQLAEALAAKNLPAMKIRDRITVAVRTRLEQQTQNREAVRRGLALLAMPQHVTVGTKALWHTADIIWRAAGDTSTDHNWYTKRATLSALYSAVLLFWLNDDSEGFSETWAFLDRRVADVMQIEKAKFQIRNKMAHLPSLGRFLGRLRYPVSPSSR